ncbi:phenoloxidase-activating factor 2-like [Aricia agestis]|uniref:phenoloxidase-activating factor 2-like n=1 Tax=Aricia agestis TaxID=91739 RepID=UPI001C208C3C|nr:phenoloxidase-activating factor 2-like [Aricia agestis]XP_041989239.1 phenoloxidase-activating factor 2-like [Aricia agestis]
MVAAIIGLLCVYVSCQNIPIRIVEDETDTLTISDMGDGTEGHCGRDVMEKYEPPKFCGISDPGDCAMKYNGKDKDIFAGFGDFPWMVALLNRTDETEWVNTDYIGGGSIIHPSVVITAAHKVENRKPEEIKCRAGEWDTDNKKENLPHQDRFVKKIVIHKDYNTSDSYNDVALLFLSEPFTLAPHVGVACLGTDMPAPGTECYSMGWGGDTQRDQEYFTILKKVTLKLVEDGECEKTYQRELENEDFTLHDSLTCAASKGDLDTCVGDGGSPLVCPVKGCGEGHRYAIYGLVAYGMGCGEQDIPGVYVNIPRMHPWVKEQMEAEGIKDYSFDV